MIIVLILMLILLVVVYLYSDSLFAELAIARNNKGAQVAFSLAEGGVQEAIYRVQYDEATRDIFLGTTNGVTTFSHDPALINQGSYSVTIQNTAKASATVTAIGQYKIGTLRTARREIKVGIAQADTPPPYPYDGGFYATGTGGGSSIADSDFWFAHLNIYDGGILANRDINFKFNFFINAEKTIEAGDDVTNQWSTVNCNCLIGDDGDPETPQCNTNPGCVPIEGAPVKSIPELDFESYKSQAQSQNQYYAKQKDFKDLIPKFGSRTFNGVVFIDGPLDIDWGRNVTINGVLAASGSITVSLGQIFVNPPAGGGASGVFSTGNVTIGGAGNLQGTGLIYAGDRIQADASFSYITNITGGLIARRTWVSGFRTINLYFSSDVINTALGNPVETPVIEVNHWEEEY